MQRGRSWVEMPHWLPNVNSTAPQVIFPGNLAILCEVIVLISYDHWFNYTREGVWLFTVMRFDLAEFKTRGGLYVYIDSVLVSPWIKEVFPLLEVASIRSWGLY